MSIRLLHPLLALLASVTRQELALQVAYLREESRILRARLPGNVRTTPRERQRLIRAGRRLGLQLKELISIVSYPTFLRWIRETEQGRVVRSIARRQPGRPRTPEEVRELVVRIRTETNFGYTRILGELRKLGIRISRQTVRNILVEAGLQPEPSGSGDDSWDAFLARHAATLWQCDFVSKPLWTPRGLVDLYLLVFLHLGTRRCWISPCTSQPDAAWVSQQARNFLADAQDLQLPPAILMRDNDGKYTAEFDQPFEQSGASIKRNTPASPNLRAHVERFIQTLQVECLDKFVVVSRRHLNHLGREFQTHYNRERPHTARGHLPPDWGSEPAAAPGLAVATDLPRSVPPPLRPGDVLCTTRLGGTLKHYQRRAA
ncbi:MAG: DDE-type integrase/transposase/recombinase [Planctomyces sp.]|nr:DDE-type integrase/transposase/recombinase [Planctomyces sp.]